MCILFRTQFFMCFLGFLEQKNQYERAELVEKFRLIMAGYPFDQIVPIKNCLMLFNNLILKFNVKLLNLLECIEDAIL